jgi:hypothetical protein
LKYPFAPSFVQIMDVKVFRLGKKHQRINFKQADWWAIYSQVFF